LLLVVRPSWAHVPVANVFLHAVLFEILISGEIPLGEAHAERDLPDGGNELSDPQEDEQAPPEAPDRLVAVLVDVVPVDEES